MISALLNLGVRLAPLVMLVAMEEEDPTTSSTTNDFHESLERALFHYEQLPPRNRPTLEQSLTQIIQSGKPAEILLVSTGRSDFSANRIVTAYQELRRRHSNVQIVPVLAKDTFENPDSFRILLEPHQGRVLVRADEIVRTALEFLLPIDLGPLVSR